jgi:hypothetical protein
MRFRAFDLGGDPLHNMASAALRNGGDIQESST